MGFTVTDVPTVNGWFKPAEHTDDVALLIEVHQFEHQRQTPNGPKDSALCDITVFSSQADLDAGRPTQILKGIRVEQTVLARSLATLTGQATIVTLTQKESKKPGQHPAWVWAQVGGTVRDKVVAYGVAREAAVQAALADAPDFD